MSIITNKLIQQLETVFGFEPPSQEVEPWLEKNYPNPYPEKSTKPAYPSRNSGSEAYRDYADLLDHYKLQKTYWDTQYEGYKTMRRIKEDVKEHFMKKRAGLEYIPDKYKEGIWNYCKQTGTDCCEENLSELCQILSK
jgi:hypothetical protein